MRAASTAALRLAEEERCISTEDLLLAAALERDKTHTQLDAFAQGQYI